MPVRARRKPIDPEIYARLVAASLPIPPRSESDNDRLIELLSNLDEREDLTPEEEAFAELLARGRFRIRSQKALFHGEAPHQAGRRKNNCDFLRFFSLSCLRFGSLGLSERMWNSCA